MIIYFLPVLHYVFNYIIDVSMFKCRKKTLVHDFLIFYNHTEQNLLPLLSENYTLQLKTVSAI